MCMTPKEISQKLKVPSDYDFYEDLYNINIGDYDFTDWEPLRDGEWDVKYTNKNDPHVVLIFDEDNNSLHLYVLKGDTVTSTVWLNGKKLTKEFDKSQFKNLFN